MTAELFHDTPVVPVITIDDASLAVDLADVLLDAGIRVMEITLRTPAGLSAIEEIAEHRPDMCVGAGSIRRADQLAEVRGIGAKFCVSPGYTVALIDAADRYSMPLIPGAATAAEVMQLAELGYNFVKFFPAEVAGGINMLKALSAPLPETQFFPTGGINAELAQQYLQLECVVCIGGSWFVPQNRIQAGEFDWISSEAKAAAGGINDA